MISLRSGVKLTPMKKFKDIYLKRPFIWTGGTFIFIAVSIILYYGEETLISTYFFGFGVITFLTWLLIYSPYKFFKFIRDKRPFNEKRNIDSFIVWVILVSLPLIGILLAILFTGHPSPAKLNATKSIHAQTVKYISAETKICSLGEITAMDGNLTCSELNAANVVVAAVKTLTDKNPYSPKNNAVRISTSNTKDEDVGYINLSTSGSNVIVKSCHKKPCSNEINRRKNTTEIK